MVPFIEIRTNTTVQGNAPEKLNRDIRHALSAERFKDSACNPTVCCSPECSSKHRQDLHAQGIYDESIAKMRSGFRDFVDRTDPEDRWTAKGWVICSPSGEIIECRNLLNFIREHPDMFDGTPKQAFDGFMKIKATRLGKRPKCPSRSWKGWTLISWSE